MESLPKADKAKHMRISPVHMGISIIVILYALFMEALLSTFDKQLVVAV